MSGGGDVIDAGEWHRILDLVGAGIGAPAGSLTLVECEVLRTSEETRLRFNAPTPVEAWTLRLGVRLANGSLRTGEVELFHWLSDAEWELSESTL